MTDALPPGLPMFVVGGNLVRPTQLLGVLFEVVARHDREVAESFAERLFEQEDASWGLNEIADAAGVGALDLYDEFKREYTARFGAKGLH